MKIQNFDGKPAILDDDNQIIIYGITCGVRYPGKAYNKLENMAEGPWNLTEDGESWTASTEGASIRFSKEGDGMAFVTDFTNLKEDLPAADDFIVMRGYFSERIKKLFGSGVLDRNGIRTNEMQSAVESLLLLPGQGMECADFAACVDERQRNFIAGFLTYCEFFGAVHVMEDGTIEVRQFTEKHPLGLGQSLHSDTVYLTQCENIVTELPKYCDLCVKYMCPTGLRRKFDVPSGYCTWYYYLADISEDTISRSVEDLVSVRNALPVQYMQIDDGWEISYGDWNANEKFPHGMKACADQIKEAGYLPGLWFAPFFAGDDEVRQSHPEYFAKTWTNGDLTSCFDYSVPEACAYAAETYRRAAYDWGFKYLKLDIITPALGAYQYKDPNFNSAKNYRKCLEIINESVPEDTFLLGCTAPFGGAIGLVDGMRVSCDIFERWDSVCRVFNSVLKRYYYHKRFFINDADCLIIRKTENEDEECRRLCIRTDEEIKTYLSVTAASGGTLMFSDKLRLLSKEQIRMLSYLYPLNTEAALPLDLLDSRIPGVLDCGIRAKIHTYVLVNWDNVPKTMRVNTGRARIFEFWSGTNKGVVDEAYESTLPAHGCEVIFAVSTDEPVVAGTDSELIPVIRQTLANGILSFDFNKKDETYYIAADEVSGNACITKRADGLFAVKQSGDSLHVDLNVGVK